MSIRYLLISNQERDYSLGIYLYHIEIKQLP